MSFVCPLLSRSVNWCGSVVPGIIPVTLAASLSSLPQARQLIIENGLVLSDLESHPEVVLLCSTHISNLST